MLLRTPGSIQCKDFFFITHCSQPVNPGDNMGGAPLGPLTKNEKKCQHIFKYHCRSRITTKRDRQYSLQIRSPGNHVCERHNAQTRKAPPQLSLRSSFLFLVPKGFNRHCELSSHFLRNSECPWKTTRIFDLLKFTVQPGVTPPISVVPRMLHR